MRTLLILSAVVLMATGVYSQSTKAKPEPTKSVYATLGGRWKATGDEAIQMTKDELLLAGGLVPSDRTLTITEFKFTAIGVDLDPLELTGKGSRFDEKMINVINRLRPGNKVLFEYIKPHHSWKDPRMLAPLTVIIKK